MFAIVGIVLFIIGLLITVGLHECGHLIPAKKFGVQVPRYFIGFGPTLWSIRAAGTQWGIKALPLGGFVQLAGMLAPARAGVRTHKSDGSPTLAQQARIASAQELDPSQPGIEFWRLKARKKLIVMFGGPCVNLLLSIVLLVVVICGIGTGTYTTTLATVQPCIDSESATCAEDQVAPGERAGLREKDIIVRWDGVPMHSWEDIQNAINSGGTDPVQVSIIRAGREQSVQVTPIETERPVVREGMVVFDPATSKPMMENKPYVGISPTIELARQPLSAALIQAGQLFTSTVRIVIALPEKLWEITVGLFSGAPRAQDSVVGLVGVADMAGSITSVSLEGYGIKERAADFLLLMASLNMSLFVFNLIPLLPLDGGHIAGALVEGVRRHVARWRGKEDPGPCDTARLLPLSYAVIGFFVVMTILLIVADIVNPVV